MAISILSGVCGLICKTCLGCSGQPIREKSIIPKFVYSYSKVEILKKKTGSTLEVIQYI